MKLQNHPGPSPGHHAPPFGEPRRGALHTPQSPSGTPAAPRDGSAEVASTWALFTAMAPRGRGELSVSRAPHAAAPAAAIFSLARTSRAGRRRVLRLRIASAGRGGRASAPARPRGGGGGGRWLRRRSGGTAGGGAALWKGPRGGMRASVRGELGSPGRRARLTKNPPLSAPLPPRGVV